MAAIRVFAHLPRLRMEVDQAAMGPGTLVKLTWESWDSITGGAFTDWRAAYEATDPVFFALAVDEELPFVAPGPPDGLGMAELKMSPRGWYEDLPRIAGPFLTVVHEALVDTIWAALMLAATGAAPGMPRSSSTVLLPTGDDHHVLVGGRPCRGIRVQGVADQEYLYSPTTAGAPLTDDQVVHAQQLVAVAQRIRGHEQLAPALRQLLATTEPTLRPGERMLLAVTALEGLLLPEVRSGEQDRFAARLVDLFGPETEATARELYRARSAALHSGTDTAKAAAVAPGAAEQLLADTLVAVDALVADRPFDPTRLDRPARVPGAGARSGVRGTAPAQRLLPRRAWWSGTATLGVSLAAEGRLVSWSPLVGLRYRGGSRRLGGLGTALTSLSGAEVVSMEEKDIRRDFVAQLQLDDVEVAALAAAVPSPGSAELDEDLVEDLLRPRDLAVVGLRLGGWHRFVDPELLGWYVYDGALRHRRETVLRQTALMRLGGGDVDELTGAAVADLGPVCDLLAAYETGGRVPEVERIFAMFRRAHDAPFTLLATRATLYFCALESMLGRFRPRRDAVQLEDLVGALHTLRPEAAAWFAENGRSLRNELAHGSWPAGDDRDGDEDDPEQLGFLRAVVAAALHELLVRWTALDPSAYRPAPARLLVDALAAGSR